MVINLAKEMPKLRPEVGRRTLEIIAGNYSTADNRLGGRVAEPYRSPDYLQRFVDQRSLNTHFFRDLYFDSLDAVEFILTLEGEFGITMPDDAIQETTTLSGLLTYLGDNVPATYKPSAKVPIIYRGV